MKLVKHLFVAVFVLIIGVSVTFAQDEVPVIPDGRVNAWDLAAPVVIYCTFDYPDADDVDYSELATVELWGLVATDDGVEGKLSLRVTADAIDEAGYNSDTDTIIDSADGYTLVRATDGSLYVTAPGYSFQWEFGDQGC